MSNISKQKILASFFERKNLWNCRDGGDAFKAFRAGVEWALKWVEENEGKIETDEGSPVVHVIDKNGISIDLELKSASGRVLFPCIHCFCDEKDASESCTYLCKSGICMAVRNGYFAKKEM